MGNKGILGLFVHAGQSAAALLQDGKIIAAGAEERFNRIKQSRAFPFEALKYCLKTGGISSPDELEAIAVPWNPAINMSHINLSGFTQWRRYDPEWLYIVPNQLLSFWENTSCVHEYSKLDFSGIGCPIYFVNHHLAHMASAVCSSPFESGLYMVSDEYGEFDSVQVGRFRGKSFEILKTIAYPNSLGVFYAALTEYLGFRPNSDEWKVMGAAAYGDPDRFLSCLEKILEWNEDEGEWVLDTRFVEHSNMKRAGYLNERLIRLLGVPARKSGDPLEQVHYDLAASVQSVAEKRIFQLADHYLRSSGERNLVAAGGCFMNSLANGKILTNTAAEKWYVPYAAADNGGAMGAPLFIDHFVLGHERCRITASPYLGPEYSDEQIESILKKFKLRYLQPADILDYTADKLAEGLLVGWFQGRMEFGERALGNRSILADPRRPDMKDKINSAVKYREAFRPFAPSILEECAEEYFDLPAEVKVPYMEQVYPIREEKRKMIPAVVHQDGTGRLQTVSSELNPRYHELISRFRKRTGIPILLNTSFNVQGEPIVCSPEDAIRCFFTCGLDLLIMGRFVVAK